MLVLRSDEAVVINKLSVLVLPAALRKEQPLGVPLLSRASILHELGFTSLHLGLLFGVSVPGALERDS
ncbi:unnamed protein product [Gongylonema pulchrum]|uniref:NR LBD domain-containing protein n=1 Tax=Gongylonema pulchrum TaxID=637853 RepID=A0A183EEX1_9BILA|nr:unnamed protein product [Gongylonema pulchrum]